MQKAGFLMTQLILNKGCDYGQEVSIDLYKCTSQIHDRWVHCESGVSPNEYCDTHHRLKFHYVNGCTTLCRTTLRLLNHFVEKAFCRIVIWSNVHFVKTVFVEHFRQNICAHLAAIVQFSFLRVPPLLCRGTTVRCKGF